MNNVVEAANWKSNMVPEEVDTWLADFSNLLKTSKPAVQVIVFPPDVYLERVKQGITNHSLPVELGAQDVSTVSSTDKPVTGEVTAEMLAAIGVSWVIIGHSERRRVLGETDDMLNQKVARAKSVGLKVIYCVPNAETRVPNGVEIIAYEPPAAIGSGKPETPEQADTVCAKIRSLHPDSLVMYGGSVTADNVASYTAKPAIDGNLIGGASLKADSFFALVSHATKP